MNILLVEDDRRVADFIRRGLSADGHDVQQVADGREGLQAARRGTFDVIVLDLGLPGMQGTEVCRALRQAGNSVPILVLTARDQLEDKVAGLRLGADDYLTKPFAFDELVARIEALARRNLPETVSLGRLVVGNLEYDREGNQVQAAGRRIELTARESAILELLMCSPSKAVARARIHAHVWGHENDPHTNVVDVYIGRLRRKIEASGTTARIETVRGLGYRVTQAGA